MDTTRAGRRGQHAGSWGVGWWVAIAAAAAIAGCPDRAPAPAAPEEVAAPASGGPAPAAEADAAAPTPEPAAEEPSAEAPAAEPDAEAPAEEADAAAPAAPEPDAAADLAALAAAPEPLPGWVDQAVGAAPRPEAPVATFAEALRTLEEEAAARKRVQARLVARTRDVVAAGDRKPLPPRSRLVAGLRAHEVLAPALDAATARLRGAEGLGEPLEGGPDLADAFSALGDLLAGAAVDAMLAGDLAEARAWAAREARLAALVSANARTLGELRAAAAMALEAFGLLDNAARRDAEGAEGVDVDLLRRLRREVAGYAARLSRAQVALNDPGEVEAAMALAGGSASRLWQREGLAALARTAGSSPDTRAGYHARQTLRRLAADGERGPVAEAARRHVALLGLDR